MTRDYFKPGYGSTPADLGVFKIDNKEMMFWQYCPIKAPRGQCFIPSNLEQFGSIIDRVKDDLGGFKWDKSFVYITAKRLWVSADNPGNRPGWHCDGFMTNDLNYIWSDSNPTEVWQAHRNISEYFNDGFNGRSYKTIKLPQDHIASMKAMEMICNDPSNGNVYSLTPKKLYRLTESVIHRVAENFQSGFRTFVKISVSDHEYALEGNSKNPNVPLSKEYAARSVERNCPTGAK